MSNFQPVELSVDFTQDLSVRSLGKLIIVKQQDKRWEKFPGVVMPRQWFNGLVRIKKFEVFDDDIFLTGFPRSGTTLAAEMIWLIANKFDFAKATSCVTDDRFPGLEYDEQTQMIQKGKLINSFDSLTRPRCIKTHLQVQFLPDDVWVKKPKMIHCSRDPRDVAVSLYHLGTHYDNSMSMDSFFDDFMKDQQIMSPYREHVMNYRNIPDYPNILYLTYESVTSDIDNAIRKVAQFLSATVSDENFQKLKDHLNFEKMKTNTACNNKLYLEKINEMTKQKTTTDDFIRRGKIGGYKDEMSDKCIAKFDKWLNDEAHLDSGFPRIRK